MPPRSRFRVPRRNTELCEEKQESNFLLKLEPRPDGLL